MLERNLEQNRFILNIFLGLPLIERSEIKKKIRFLAVLRCLILGCYDEANFGMLVLSRYIARAIVPLMHFSLCMRTECNVININQEKSQNGPL